MTAYSGRTVVGLAVALGLSLCANAFMGGLVVARHEPPPEALAQMGAPGGGFRSGGGGPDRLHGAVNGFAQRLPPDLRDAMTKAMQSARTTIDERMKSVQQARQAVQAAMQAEPFDPEKLRAALAAQRAAQSNVQEAVQEGIITALEGMTPDQRAQLANSDKRLFR